MPILVDTGAVELLRRRDRKAESLVLRHYPPRLRAQLLTFGVQLPDPDYWIAAHALECRLPLLSTDRDFRHIAELVVHYVAKGE